MVRIIGGCQRFMSFIGNITAAQTAKVLGKYNERVAFRIPFLILYFVLYFMLY